MVNLTKGGNVNLQKEAAGQLKNIRVGLGWDENATSTGNAFDADVTAFLLGENGKLLPGTKSTSAGDVPNYMLYYNNLETPDGFAKHTGDNLTGAGAGDDESISFDLSKCPAGLKEVVFVVTIHEAASRGQNFGQINNAFIRVIDETNGGAELCRYDLSEDYSVETALEFGRLYLNNGEWKFKAVGTGQQTGLDAYVTQYF